MKKAPYILRLICGLYGLLSLVPTLNKMYVYYFSDNTLIPHFNIWPLVVAYLFLHIAIIGNLPFKIFHFKE